MPLRLHDRVAPTRGPRMRQGSSGAGTGLPAIIRIGGLFLPEWRRL